MSKHKRRRKVVGKFSTYYVCDVHGWDFTNVDEDVCPVCLGESMQRERILKFIAKLQHKGMTHSEACVSGHVFADRLIALIKGKNNG